MERTEPVTPPSAGLSPPVDYPSRPLLIGLWSPVMGSGKTTFANALVSQEGFRKTAIASTLKDMVRTFLESSGINPYDAAELIADPELKEAPLDCLMGKSPRYAMQTLGTEWGRDLFGHDFWVSAALKRAVRIQSAGISVVIDDVRFRNEADAIHKAGGYVVQVVRPGVPIPTSAGHASEAGLGLDFAFDATIINDSTERLLDIEARNLCRTLRSTVLH